MLSTRRSRTQHNLETYQDIEQLLPSSSSCHGYVVLALKRNLRVAWSVHGSSEGRDSKEESGELSFECYLVVLVLKLQRVLYLQPELALLKYNIVLRRRYRPLLICNKPCNPRQST